MSPEFDVRALLVDRNLEGLLAALRYPRSAVVRAEAAQALGELGKFEAVESLVRASQKDPERQVKSAALAALHQLVGNRAEAVIASYGEEGDEAPWVQPDQERPAVVDIWKDYRSTTSSAGASWTRDDIHALLSILRTETKEPMRLRAIQALSQIQDTQAIDALAQISLWEEDRASREAARAALQHVFGEKLEEILQSYREGAPAAETDWEDLAAHDEAGSDELDTGLEDQQALPRSGEPAGTRPTGSPVVQEVKAGWGTALVAGLLLLAIMAVIFILLNR